jgi:hypothetical protein
MTKTAMDVAIEEVAFCLINVNGLKWNDMTIEELTPYIRRANEVLKTKFTHNNKKYSLRLVEEDAELPSIFDTNEDTISALEYQRRISEAGFKKVVE